METLRHKREQSLVLSERAVLTHRAAYRKIKTLVETVITGPVDICDYYPAAKKLTRLLNSLNQVGPGTIFQYFVPHIDPCQYGDVRYFRATCIDLANQINALAQWRAERAHLRLVKS